jgi:hypothetical protein
MPCINMPPPAIFSTCRELTARKSTDVGGPVAVGHFMPLPVSLRREAFAALSTAVRLAVRLDMLTVIRQTWQEQRV